MNPDVMRRITGVIALISWPLLFAAAVAALVGTIVPTAVVLLLAAASTSGTVGWLLMTALPNVYEAWSHGIDYGRAHPPLKSERTEPTVNVGGNVLGFRRR